MEKKHIMLFRFCILIVMITALGAQCQTHIFSNQINNHIENIPKLTNEKTTIPNQIQANMMWTSNNNASTFLCPSTIVADIALNFVRDTKNTLTGSALITYRNIATQKTGTCADCQLTGHTEQFVVTGKVRESKNEKTQAEITIAFPINLHESITSKICADDVARTPSTHYLLFSLQQAGFFQPWTISLTDNATKEFSWFGVQQNGNGTMRVVSSL